MTGVRDAVPGYVLEHRLGEGATGTVWRARQTSSMDRPVAVKRVRVGPAAAGEAEVLLRLDHPHIVRVFEVVPDGDGVAIVMQLAASGSLAERLARLGPRPMDEVLDVVTKVAGALASAHRAGVVHGDVKPANILFTAEGEPLLGDFGIAGTGDDGMIRGTTGYVDPTVVAGRLPDARSDVYGLAAVARAMLGPDAPLPPAIQRALAEDPADRFASVDEFASTFGHREADISASRCPNVTRTFGPRPPRPAAARTPRWRPAAAVVALVLAAEAAVVVSLHRPARAVAAVAPAACPALAPPAAGSVLLVGDTDGDGCPNAVVRTDNVIEVDGRDRFVLGADGDVPMLGDWDCDGIATPGLFRPATGESFVFDRWMEVGEAEVAAARLVPRVTSRPCADPRGRGRG